MVARTVGNADVRMVEIKTGWRGVVWHKGKRIADLEGSDRNVLWQELLDKAAATNPKYFGFKGAVARFAENFPGGFSSSVYLNNERNLKDLAWAILNTHAPLEKALAGHAPPEQVLAAFQKGAMLHPTFEIARVQQVLRGPDAQAFIHGAALFADEKIFEGLTQMEPALRRHDVAKWTAVTYLPSLWRPKTHIFMKPEATIEFAERVGHGFAEAYEARLKPAVYECLRDLAAKTEREIAALDPSDWIDVQSFIWVVGRYDTDDTARMQSLSKQTEDKS
jgi:hypothetical protein